MSRVLYTFGEYADQSTHTADNYADIWDQTNQIELETVFWICDYQTGRTESGDLWRWFWSIRVRSEKSKCTDHDLGPTNHHLAYKSIKDWSRSSITRHKYHCCMKNERSKSIIYFQNEINGWMGGEGGIVWRESKQCFD